MANDNDDDDLRNDLDAGLRFTHRMASQAKRGVTDLTVAVEALLEELVESTRLDEDALDRKVDEQRKALLEQLEDHERVRIEPGLDKYSMTGLPDIDCASLIHLCRGRCCTLNFPLSRQDLGERVVKWTYDHPYMIRQGDDGYCVHNDSETKFCTIYHHRPAVCRYYDCRKDQRIWVDFEQRIPAVDPALSPREAPTPKGPAPDMVVVDADPL
jgi:Fe-S-cluster containining protein